MKRLRWVDTLKLFAMLVIMAVHFLDMLWQEGLEAYAGTVLVRYFSGKSMVALFTVILGYFAAKPRKMRVISYTLRRYTEFAFHALVTTLAFIAASYIAVWLFHTPDSYAAQIISDGFRYNLIYTLRDALLFECNYIDTYWCLGQFVIAGALCYALSRYGGALPLWARFAVPAALIVAAFATGNTYISWIAIGLMGYILRVLTDNFTLRRIPALGLILLSVLMLTYPMAECVTLYYIQGLAALGILTAIFSLPGVQTALSIERLEGMSDKIIGMFMTHVPVLSLLRSTLYPLFDPIASRVLCLALYLPLVLLAAGMLRWLYKPVSEFLSREKQRA